MNLKIDCPSLKKFTQTPLTVIGSILDVPISIDIWYTGSIWICVVCYNNLYNRVVMFLFSSSQKPNSPSHYTGFSNFHGREKQNTYLNTRKYNRCVNRVSHCILSSTQIFLSILQFWNLILANNYWFDNLTIFIKIEIFKLKINILKFEISSQFVGLFYFIFSKRTIHKSHT